MTMKPAKPCFTLQHLAAMGCLLMAFAANPLMAAEEAPQHCFSVNAANEQLSLQEVTCISDDELQTLRGGFMQDNQIVIGFGFERIVSIDGEIQEHVLAGLPVLNLTNNMQLVPITRSFDMTSQRVVLSGNDLGELALQRVMAADGAVMESMPQIQLAPSSAALQDMMSNIIQNTVDGRTIEQMRVLNIDLMGIGDVPKFDPQRDLHPSLIEALGL